MRRRLSPRPPAREFAEQVLRPDMEQYQLPASAAAPVFFFDRCVLDALAMLDQLGLVPATERQALLAYSRTALIFPPWEEIYTTDDERDHSLADAVAVHAAATDWYRRCGYDLVEVPRGSVAFVVLNSLRMEGASQKLPNSKG